MTGQCSRAWSKDLNYSETEVELDYLLHNGESVCVCVTTEHLLGYFIVWERGQGHKEVTEVFREHSCSDGVETCWLLYTGPEDCLRDFKAKATSFEECCQSCRWPNSWRVAGLTGSQQGTFVALSCYRRFLKLSHLLAFSY